MHQCASHSQLRCGMLRRYDTIKTTTATSVESIGVVIYSSTVDSLLFTIVTVVHWQSSNVWLARSILPKVHKEPSLDASTHQCINASDSSLDHWCRRWQWRQLRGFWLEHPGCCARTQPEHSTGRSSVPISSITYLADKTSSYVGCLLLAYRTIPFLTNSLHATTATHREWRY